MRAHRLKILVFTVIVVPVLACAQAPAAPVQAFADSFLVALKRGDGGALAGFFADTVRFAGEGRLVSINGMRGAVELPVGARELEPEPGMTWASNFRAAMLKGTDVSSGFARTVAEAGIERWQAVLNKVQPTLTRVSTDGDVYRHTKAGDYVYDLHVREANKGARANLDEAMLFVIRQRGTTMHIVVMWADL
jgi:hypothetical protein